MSDYYLWNKATRTQFGPYFEGREFECRNCDCTDQRISKELISRLTLVRKLIGVPLIVTSGYRCAKKQAKLRAQGAETAVGVSQHELGNAADITVSRLDLFRAALEGACNNFFDAVGYAKGFIHVDLRSDKKRRWTYSK